MTALEQLEALVSTSLGKVRSGECKTIADALIPAMPEVVAGLRRLVTEPGSTPTARLAALNMLLTLHARCMKEDLRAKRFETAKERLKAKREVASAAKMRARADERKAAAKTHAERRRFARMLKKGETQ